MNIKNIANLLLNFTIRRIAEIFGISVLATGTLLFTALFTYSPDDPNFIFPNVEIDLVRDNISSIIYEPVAPDRTTAKMGFFFLGDAATSQEHAEGRKTAMDRWLGPERSKDANDGVRNQDFRIWEAIQIAKGSPAADANIFSPLWEGNPHYFHNHILDYLEA